MLRKLLNKKKLLKNIKCKINKNLTLYELQNQAQKIKNI